MISTGNHLLKSSLWYYVTFLWMPRTYGSYKLSLRHGAQLLSPSKNGFPGTNQSETPSYGWS